MYVMYPNDHRWFFVHNKGKPKQDIVMYRYSVQVVYSAAVEKALVLDIWYVSKMHTCIF